MCMYVCMYIWITGGSGSRACARAFALYFGINRAGQVKALALVARRLKVAESLVVTRKFQQLADYRRKIQQLAESFSEIQQLADYR